jgi:ABC-2 type transport system permease protein
MTTFPSGTFTPAPRRGRIGRMLRTHARTELLLTVRNGEQLLLTLLIPLALLIGLTLIDVIALPSPRVDAVTPRVFALAVMSSAFTGQAIALGFDRRYGVIKRLAATALPRWLLVCGRLLACVVVVVGQLVVLGLVAALLGWSPSLGGLAGSVGVVLLGVLAFGALGVLLGGSLKAEIVLALANIVWLVLLLGGGVLVATTSMPAGVADVVRLLPSGALADALRALLAEGSAPSVLSLVVLAVWGVVGAGLAVRTTKLS